MPPESRVPSVPTTSCGAGTMHNSSNPSSTRALGHTRGHRRPGSHCRCPRRGIRPPIRSQALEAPKGRMHLGKARQPGEEVGRAAQHLLQVLGRVGRDLRTEAAGGHVEEQPPIRLTQVDRPGCRPTAPAPRQAATARRLHGRSRWRCPGQQRQARVLPGQGHGLGDIAQGAVATAGDQGPVTGVQRLADDAPGVAALPGDAHRQFPSRIATRLHGCAHLLVQCLFSMQDQQRLALARTTPFTGESVEYMPRTVGTTSDKRQRRITQISNMSICLLNYLRFCRYELDENGLQHAAEPNHLRATRRFP